MAKIQTYLVTTAEDGKAAESMKVPCAYLFYRIGEKGMLQRTQYAGTARGGLMGIFGCEGLGSADISRLSRDIFMECNRRGYRGVLLDMMPDLESVDKLTLLSSQLNQKGLRHFVPVEVAHLAPAAKIIIPSSISGGSYADMLSDYAGRYGAANLCLEMVRICHDFTMPAYSPDGVALTAAQFNEIVEQYRPSPFFSQEMECKYFTYQGADGKTHFVLYDDPNTAAQKIETAAGFGFFGAFLLYREWGTGAREIISGLRQ